MPQDPPGSLFDLAVAQARLEEKVTALRAEVHEVKRDVEALAKAQEMDAKERRKGQEDRQKERRTMLLALGVAAVGLAGTFIATLVPLLTGGHP